MKNSLFVLVISYCFAYYSGQIIFGIFILILYALSSFVIRITSGKKSQCTINLFTFFYFVYGLLVLFSHIELIKDPWEDFYVHNDAAWSFYKAIMTYVLPCEWGELYEKTISNPAFHLYPLAAYIMGAWGKLGQELGIDNLRLFLRIIPFYTGSITVALMADLLQEKNKDRSTIYKYLIPFGLFSYLFISSAIFSRDCLVCLAFTFGAIVFLKDNVRFRIGWFFLLFIISAGLRPHNGLLFLVYPFAYYYKDIKRKIGGFSVVLISIGMAATYYYLQDMFSDLTKALEGYNDKSLSNTGGLFIIFYTLPFPLNTIIMMIYMMLQPLPIFFFIKGDGGTWLNLPNVLSPYLMFLCFSISFLALKNKQIISKIKTLIVVSIIVYGAIVFGSPDIRRAFAAIPGLYLCYCLVEADCPKNQKQTIRNVGWIGITVINILFIFYVYL